MRSERPSAVLSSRSTHVVVESPMVEGIAERRLTPPHAIGLVELSQYGGGDIDEGGERKRWCLV